MVLKGYAPCHGFEISVADFQRKGFAGHTVPIKAGSDLPCQFCNDLLKQLQIREIFGEGCLLSHRLSNAVRLHLPVISATDDMVVAVSRFPKMSNKIRFMPLLQVTPGVDPQRLHLLPCRLPHPMKFTDWKLFKKMLRLLRCDHGETVRFILS